MAYFQKNTVAQDKKINFFQNFIKVLINQEQQISVGLTLMASNWVLNDAGKCLKTSVFR